MRSHAVASAVALVLLAAVAPARAQIPADWAARVVAGHMMASVSEPNVALMPYVGNGYVATEIHSDSLFVGGLFNGVGTTEPSHRARIPAPTNAAVTCAQSIASAIDFEWATYFHRCIAADGVTRVEERWYAHRTMRSVLVYEVALTNPTAQARTVSVSATPNWPTKDVNFTQLTPGAVPAGATVYAGAIVRTEFPTSQRVNVALITTQLPATLAAPANAQSVYTFVTAVATDITGDCVDSANGPIDCAVSAWQTASATASDVLWAEHVTDWAHSIWSRRIEVGGDLSLAAAVNASSYYILASIRADWPWSLSPGGLASNSYNGHTFWDFESWMYPALLPLWPELAGSGLQYRINHLAGAAAKAQSYDSGYAGFMFPWESAFSGEEVCPISAPTGQLEQHITGDIGEALWMYWMMTNDTAWLNAYGYPALKGIAQFWASRVSTTPAPGCEDSARDYLRFIDVANRRDGVHVIDSADSGGDSEQGQQYGPYFINYLIPPDEYAVNVSDSAYTNYVAGMAMQRAGQSAELTGHSGDNVWGPIVAGLVYPYNATGQWTPEYCGYVPGTVIKQADVVLLGFPLDGTFSTTQRRNDLLMYEAATDPNGPAMTWAMHAIAYLDIGDEATAALRFKRGYANAQPPFNVWTETPTGGAINFITGAGGFLQSVIYGYPGLRVDHSGPALASPPQWTQPRLPPAVTSMAFRGIQYWGLSVDFEYTATSATWTLTANATPALRLYIRGTNCNPMYRAGDTCVADLTASNGPYQLVALPL